MENDDKGMGMRIPITASNTLFVIVAFLLFIVPGTTQFNVTVSFKVTMPKLKSPLTCTVAWVCLLATTVRPRTLIFLLFLPGENLLESDSHYSLYTLFLES